MWREPEPSEPVHDLAVLIDDDRHMAETAVADDDVIPRPDTSVSPRRRPRLDWTK